MAWELGNGTHIRVGFDPIVRGSVIYKLSYDLIKSIRSNGIYFLNHVYGGDGSEEVSLVWYNSNRQRFGANYRDEWDGYIKDLKRNGI